MRQTETRSETERHWDILGMTTLTVATAAVAAVFLITRNSQQSPGPAEPHPTNPAAKEHNP